MTLCEDSYFNPAPVFTRLTYPCQHLLPLEGTRPASENDQDVVLYPKGDEILVLRNEIKKRAIKCKATSGAQSSSQGLEEISRSRTSHRAWRKEQGRFLDRLKSSRG